MNTIYEIFGPIKIHPLGRYSYILSVVLMAYLGSQRYGEVYWQAALGFALVLFAARALRKWWKLTFTAGSIILLAYFQIQNNLSTAIQDILLSQLFTALFWGLYFRMFVWRLMGPEHYHKEELFDHSKFWRRPHSLIMPILFSLVYSIVPIFIFKFSLTTVIWPLLVLLFMGFIFFGKMEYNERNPTKSNSVYNLLFYGTTIVLFYMFYTFVFSVA
ncbi:MAG: hypothetical protein HY362_02940 [Candidatus Aenigmarchaeota archaeon]|nr:hypothetical protein [Candidatus Aenigmarchaeota archaeon]